MTRFDALAAAVLVAATVAGTAFGGDLPPEISVPEVSVKEARGFYGRADLGYAVQSSLRGAQLQSYDAASDNDSSARFDSTRFGGNNFSGGLGVGYQFSDLFRADLTGDLFRADLTGDLFRGDFDGKFATTAPCAGGAGGTGCAGKTAASFSAGSVMANGYVDIGTVAGFTPYIGAGLGATRVSWGDVRTTSACVGGTLTCASSASASVRNAGDADWHFTYAVMAGVAYQLASNIKLDLGYRYSHVAGGDMFGSSTGGVSGRDGAMARQEIRVGLRVSTW